MFRCFPVAALAALVGCTQPEPVDPTLRPIPREPAVETGVTFSGEARFGVSKGL